MAPSPPAVPHRVSCHARRETEGRNTNAPPSPRDLDGVCLISQSLEALITGLILNRTGQGSSFVRPSQTCEVIQLLGLTRSRSLGLTELILYPLERALLNTRAPQSHSGELSSPSQSCWACVSPNGRRCNYRMTEAENFVFPFRNRSWKRGSDSSIDWSSLSSKDDIFFNVNKPPLLHLHHHHHHQHHPSPRYCSPTAALITSGIAGAE
ncbi:unnamed protein product [Pleuronectes platessa]|uniref:Uncharacterized protein n=1 Tax=Pleuronectes platessa TaxID=8262 RepID=A0A9N7Z7T3_PLEPL|nr:unnamed protein product [Pleuronectes platessa]